MSLFKLSLKTRGQFLLWYKSAIRWQSAVDFRSILSLYKGIYLLHKHSIHSVVIIDISFVRTTCQEKVLFIEISPLAMC